MINLRNYIFEHVNDPKDNEVFVVIKPGFLKVSKEIIKMIEDNGFTMVKCKTKLLLPEESRKLYYTHKDEDWYKDLCKYMSSDLSLGLLFKYKGSPFKKMESIKEEVRKKFGESDMRNAMHSSDSYDNMLKEQYIYFG